MADMSTIEALREIAGMDPNCLRADDLGKAARIARAALAEAARPERERFEAWARANTTLSLQRDPDDSESYYRASAEGPWLAWQARASLGASEAAPVGWADEVEQRLLTWRQRFVNKSGDQLALDDFMGQESIDDLIDFVCAPLAAAPSTTTDAAAKEAS